VNDAVELGLKFIQQRDSGITNTEENHPKESNLIGHIKVVEAAQTPTLPDIKVPAGTPSLPMGYPDKVAGLVASL
jgi:hypothetical protein